MAVVAIRSNSQPAGGTTTTQPVTPAVTPAAIADLVEQLTPTIAKFRAASTPQMVTLDQASIGLGVAGLGPSKSVQIAQVGLGVRIVSEHSVTITLNNTAASAVTVNVSPLFPYDLIANTNVQINGGATVYSASGIAGLVVALRNRKGTFNFNTLGGFGPALSPALVRVSVSGTSVTTTNATAPTFSGLASISIPASTTATVTATFYTFEKLALDRESLLGLLPLQNSQTFAVIARTLVSAIGGNNPTYPFYASGGWPSTLTTTVQDVISSNYEFWSIPPDPGLYQEMVTNSYQVQEATSLQANATGPGALVYPLPTNAYHLAAHLWLFDANGNPLPATALSKIVLQYNAGSVVPVTIFQGRHRAAQFLDYADDRQAFAGYRFWDGEDTTEDITDTDQAGWIDTYAAATPQLVADVGVGIATPVVYSVTRESVVAGSVQVVGG
ncbi:MAG TPA: hypothetical protein VFD49_09195 [Candidatus Dormibacteraeota bacterium]|nr:hypothetical protein [Candidatus Dormibacteraeota bacterium]